MKWYQKTWVAILFLVFFAPVGIFLIWKYHSWSKIAKIICSAVFGFIFFIAMIGSCSDEEANIPANNEPVSRAISAQTLSPSPTSTPESTPIPTHTPASAPTATPTPTLTPTPTPTPYDEAMVLGSGVNMRTGASTQADIVEKVGSDTEIEVIGEENEWYYVRANGTEGYIHKDYIVIGVAAIAAAKATPKQITSQATNDNKTIRPDPTQKTEEEPTPKPTSTPKPTVEPTATPKVESKQVYYTKTGKRYHYDNPCGNGTYYPCTLDEALKKGLTPCENCVLR